MASRLNARPSYVAALLAAAATLTALPNARAQLDTSIGPVRNPANGNVYFKTAAAPWGNCENLAQILLGAHLVTINDAAENAWVLNTFSVPVGQSLWIGLSDFAVEGSYVWSSGEVPTYRNWAPGQPDNAGGLEDYVHMLGNGQWNDNQNAAPSIYGVIEVPCNISIIQSAVNFDTGSNYRLLSPSSWSCAEMYARDVLGAHLTTINDADENAFVRSTFVVSHTNPRVWLGLNDFVTEGTYVWADGSASTYRNWYPGEPNDQGNADFVVMYLGGQWDDVKDVENGASVGPTGGLVENSCGNITIESGPFVNPANGHTYYRLSPSTWSCAEARARAMGGHLASINNAAENEYIRSNLVTGSTVAAFGLNDYTTDGTYANMNGDAVSYTNWAAGQPANTDPNADFAVMSATGSWSIIPNIVPFDVRGIVELPYIVNDGCGGAMSIPREGGTYVGTNIGADVNGSSTCSVLSSPDVWFAYGPTNAGPVAFSTVGGVTDFDTILSVHSACPGNLFNQIACNDNFGGTPQSTVVATMPANATVFVRVAGALGSVGRFTLTVTPLNNDRCSSKRDLGSGNQQVNFNNTSADTDGPAEPSCDFCCNEPQINGDLWYLWRAAATQRVVLNTCTGGAGFDTKIGVYTGNVCPTTSGSIAACNDDQGPLLCPSNSFSSRVSFVAPAGSQHTIRVGGFGTSRGSGTLSISTYCIADLDDGSGLGTPDGGVTIDDLLFFLQAFANGAVAADVDDGSGTGTPDGGVTIDDLLFFLSHYEAGC